MTRLPHSAAVLDLSFSGSFNIQQNTALSRTRSAPDLGLQRADVMSRTSACKIADAYTTNCVTGFRLKLPPDIVLSESCELGRFLYGGSNL